MPNMGDRIKAEIEAKLEGIVAEEELRGMIDAALPKARDRLQRKVQDHVDQAFANTFRPWIEKASSNKELPLEAECEKLGRMILEALAKEYRKQAEELAAGQGQGGKLVSLVDEALVEKLCEIVRKDLVEWSDGKACQEKAGVILKEILPQAFGHVLEGAAMRALGVLSRSAEVSVSSKVVQELEVRECPSCKSDLVRCPKCSRPSVKGQGCPGCGHYNTF